MAWRCRVPVLVLVLVDMWGGCKWWVIEKAVLGMFCGARYTTAGRDGGICLGLPAVLPCMYYTSIRVCIYI